MMLLIAQMKNWRTKSLQKFVFFAEHQLNSERDYVYVTCTLGTLGTLLDDVGYTQWTIEEK